MLSSMDYCEKSREILHADRYVMKAHTRTAGPWEFGDFPKEPDENQIPRVTIRS